MTTLVHGGIDHDECARLGIDPAAVVDFSVNGNPYGPAPGVWAAARAADIARYPDRACGALTRAILDTDLAGSGLVPANVRCGNGAAELIFAVARAFLESGDTAAVVAPAYGDYGAACAAARATVIAYRTVPPDFALAVERVAAWIAATRPRLLWLCNPDNPTGRWLPPDDLLPLIVACRATGTRLVVDESYRRFLSPPAPRSVVETCKDRGWEQVIVLRSLTKEYALPGLRLGYLVADGATVAAIGAQLPPWNVGAAAQDAGVAALRDRDHLHRTLARLAAERAAFFAALAARGFTIAPAQPTTHFCLIDVGDGRAVRQALLARGLLVRDCASFGLPHCIRAATRPEWPRLVDALCAIGPHPPCGWMGGSGR